MQNIISRHDDGRYCLSEPVSSQVIIELARDIVAESFHRPDKFFGPECTRDFLTLQLAPEEREVFAVIFLDRQNQVLAFEKIFFGTVDTTTVHPREVLRRCMHHNAMAVVLAHNHPSGYPEPSKADIDITHRLQKVLSLVDVKILDHFVVGGTKLVSFSERGML